ncbi:HAMP domain-containing histidine kinase [Candidatus Falkowbacteria bacterium]|nr:HAMP domain-containing histidine kinase [Candidatus Falkowbacteria bacterium]
MPAKEKLQFIKKNYQIVYSIILIVFIPLAIILNTVVFTRSFQRAIDQDLQGKAISIGDAINVSLIGNFDKIGELQNKIEAVSRFNDEIVSADILTQSGEDFKVVASLNKDVVGRVTKENVNVLAWRENKPVALLTTSGSNNSIDNVVKFDKQPARYWAVIMPMKDATGAKQMLLSMKISVAAMDKLTRDILIRSYVILLITVLIIILLLANNTRLFEYAALYRKIKEIDQMKDEFISVASHELRTPVTGIRGFVSMILAGDLGPISDKAKESLGIVQSSADRLSVLVDDLLNVSRIEQGRMAMSPKPTDVSSVIKETMAELRVQSEQKGLSMVYQPHKEELPLISIDSERFKQILFNLVGNAIKYTPKGQVEVMTEEKNQRLEIKIKDTGLGMSAKARERLFEKFYRIQTEETSNITGTGLGLWITKQLITMQGGEITIDSIEKVGTQITISFPIIKN